MFASGTLMRMHTRDLFRRVVTLSIISALSILTHNAHAQPVKPTNGPKHVAPRWHALTGATVTVSPGDVIENATIIIRDGLITDVRTDGPVPDGARVWECDGLHITPAFIEPFFEVDAPEPSSAGAHWNAMVTPQRSALDGGGISSDDADALRKMGFAIAHISPKSGIFRGRTAAVSLRDGSNEESSAGTVLRESVFNAASLDRASGRSTYPNSLMGSIALARQTLADVDWYAQARLAAQRPEDNAALAALVDQSPLMWDVSDELMALRATKVANEFGRLSVIVGSGTEYRRLDAIVATDAPLILPLAFPRKPLVATEADRESVSLRALQSWEIGRAHV